MPTSGAYPRGIAVDPASTAAYVAIMGPPHIAVVDLDDFSVLTIDGSGNGPRDLRMSPDGGIDLVHADRAG